MFYFINKSLDLIEEYDEELKHNWKQRKLSLKEESSLEESKWNPVKQDFQDMSRRHLTTIKLKIQSNSYYSSFNQKLRIDEWIQMLYDYTLHAIDYLR